MEQKQTAVEWLQSEIKKLNISVDGATQVSTIRIFEQAKEMEKQQIVYAHLLGLIRSLDIPASEQAEQYYNEEYGK